MSKNRTNQAIDPTRDIHSEKFDGTKMSQKELWAADSFTRGAALEQMDRKHKGDYGYALAKESRAGDGAGFSNGERGTASRGARYAGDMARSRAMAYNDAVTGQEEREQLSKDRDAMRGQLSGLRSELSKVKDAQAAGAAAPPEKGDLQIEGVTNEDLERSAAKGKAQDWLNSNSQPTSSGIFNSDSGDQQAPTAEGAGEEKAFNNEKYMIDFGSQATNKKAVDFSGV